MAFKRRTQYNPKRRIEDAPEAEALKSLVDKVQYGGNPEHKRNPGDFGLTPPASPRAHKSLCDDANVVTKNEALSLLKAGIQKGLISVQKGHGGLFPQNIWTVKQLGNGEIALESQLENPISGFYHGYPMPENDPMSKAILERWKRNHE